jgi:hypothetical protein
MAHAIWRLALATGVPGATYHIEHPRAVTHDDVMRVLHALGYAIRLTGEQDFMASAAQLADDDETLAVVLQTQAAEDGGAVAVSSDWTLRQLAELGFECPRVSARWFQKFVEHAIDVGFLEPPRFRRRIALPDLRFRDAGTVRG